MSDPRPYRSIWESDSVAGSRSPRPRRSGRAWRWIAAAAVALVALGALAVVLVRGA